MASSRQNSSQMLNSQSSSSNSTNSTSSRDKTVHTKSDAKNKHDKSSSSSSGHVPMSSNTIINSMNNMSKRKGTSFQITSVSVSSGNNQQPQSQQQRDNNDYETPSFSEDTFSREDVFFAQPNALGTAPVIPTSSQYGLAIVGTDLSGNGANLSDVHVSVSDAGINIMGQLPNKQDVDHKNERFKVVKIESTEPFKRGRWMCMDYLDHTTLQAQDDGTDGSPKEDGDENIVRTKDSGLELGMDGSEMNDNGDMEHDNEGLDQEVMRAEMMNNHDGHHTQASHEHQHHHTMTSIPIHNEINLGAQQSQAQSMPQGHIQQIISQNEKPNESSSSRGEMNPSSDTLPTQASQNQQPNFVGGPNQQHTFVAADNNSAMISHHAQSMTPDTIQRSLQQHDQQAHNQQMQGVTLPTNILMQNLGLEQHHQHGNASGHQATPSPLPVQGENAGEMDNRQQHQLLQDSQTSQFQNQQVGAGDNKPSNESEQGSGVSTNDNLINNSVSDINNMNSNDGTQNTLSPSSSAGLGTVAEGGSAVGGGGASELNSNNASNAAAPGADDGQSIAEDSESASGTSAVAIDNKIEQAMDLVKSHLMFAVREEVEVLKEKINELMDRINQLEVENTILKANASQETLSQLTTAATIVAPQVAQVQTSPAQPPALSKINIDASILHLAGHTQSQPQPQQQPPVNPPPQNPTATS